MKYLIITLSLVLSFSTFAKEDALVKLLLKTKFTTESFAKHWGELPAAKNGIYETQTKTYDLAFSDKHQFLILNLKEEKYIKDLDFTQYQYKGLSSKMGHSFQTKTFSIAAKGLSFEVFPSGIIKTITLGTPWISKKDLTKNQMLKKLTDKELVKP